ncbi:MAG: alpha/beta hydrolase [Bdellovibrionaceae bacterium]|nr:alpha/beta hydrolase [Pseudobdellovibrionaceae bacterium]
MSTFIYFLKNFIVLYIILLIVLYFIQRKLIYYPLKTRPQLDNLSEFYTEVETQTKEDFKLTHWYAKQGPPYIVVFHGNAGNIEARGYRFKFLVDQNYSVLLVSYRGYGVNPGKASERHLIDDSSLVLEWLLKKEGISSTDVILFGESLGSGVAIALASKYPVKALIFDGAFSSITDVAKSIYSFIPVKWMLKDSWNSEIRIQKSKAPSLFIHAKNDSIVPFRFGEKLFSLANEPKKHIWLEDSDHNSNLEKESVRQSIFDFIQSL